MKVVLMKHVCKLNTVIPSIMADPFKGTISVVVVVILFMYDFYRNYKSLYKS